MNGGLSNKNTQSSQKGMILDYIQWRLYSYYIAVEMGMGKKKWG